ncbi:MAG: myo-inosose-2 dehydratase [Candidatus Marinimicrobia bacterium]|nr:myo-inosose-2 dehydratase [Candidatus Neomarinimicrobiota bacterium]
MFSKMNSSVKIGIAPINWSNDDMPELGENITLELCLSDMQAAGYIGTEFGHKFPKTADKLRPLLDTYDLSLAAMWHSTYFVDNADLEQELDKLQQRIEFLTEMGTSVINLAECSRTVHNKKDIALSKKPIFNPQEWDRLIHGLNKAGELCNLYGIKAAVHHHMGTGIQSQDEIDRLMENTDPNAVFLCADTGHLTFAGINPLLVFEKYIDRIVHVHLKDLRGSVLKKVQAKDCSFLEAVLRHVFTVPGDGMIDFKPIFEILASSAYDGWMIVEAEQDPAWANPLRYAKTARDYLNNIANN